MNRNISIVCSIHTKPHFTLQEYDSFIDCSMKILPQRIESDKFNVLLNIMTNINDIKKRDENAAELFDGLKKDLFTLLQYDVHVSKRILAQVVFVFD